MQLRSPAEYFYKYLIVHPEGYDNHGIEEILEDNQIDYLGDDYVNKLRGKLKIPEPFFPTVGTHTPSLNFLCDEQILQLYQPENETPGALDLLEAPRAREFVETMLLSHAPLEAIAKTVTRYGQRCNKRTIELYSHFFWNVTLLDSTQMKTLLNWRVEKLNWAKPVGTPAEPGIVDNQLATAARKASYQDPRKLAAELPFSPFAALLVQMRMGVTPEHVDVAGRMSATRDMATLRALETLHFAGPGDAGRAFNYAMTAKIMNELLETVQKPDEQLREQLSAIALRTDDRPVPSIHQLSEGRHTVDLQPTPEGAYEPKPLRDPGEGD
jgi:hypothetical protein